MIRTERLHLRRPEPRDLAPLSALWADPVVMANLGPVKDWTASEESFARHCVYWENGFGFWIVEHEEGFAGFAGFKPGAPDTPIADEVEAGWMFAARFWGKGFAHEAMTGAFRWGWERLSPARIVAITAERNDASRKLMTRLGMTHLPEMSFVHPLLQGELRRTVTYAIERPSNPVT